MFVSMSFINLSSNVSISSSTYLSAHLFSYSSIALSDFQSIHLSFHLSISVVFLPSSGGFEEWFEYYPTVTDGRPPPKEPVVPVMPTDVDVNLDFDYEFEEYDPNKYRDPPATHPTQHLSKTNEIDAFHQTIPNGFPQEEARFGNIDPSSFKSTTMPSIDRSLKPKTTPEMAWTDDVAFEGKGLHLDSPSLRLRAHDDFSSSSRESLNSADSSEEAAAAAAALAAERDKELKRKEVEMSEKQERLRQLEETLETKQREMEALHRNIEEQRIARQREEEERERRRIEEEARKIETENLRNERKAREAEERKKQAERENSIREKEEEARQKLQAEREELERMRAATEADKKRVAAEKAAVEENKRKLEEAARSKPKPTGRSGSPGHVITPQKQSQVGVTPSTASSLSSPKNAAAPKTRPLVDRTAKPNANNNAKVIVDWRSRQECLRPVGGGRGPGMTGLRNLGNTCYMNSIIQCLSSTGFLTFYFRQEYFVQDINLTTKLGSKGELAVEFANIIRALWRGDFQHISPRNFKQTVGRINGLFAGSDQQDSSELLLFLLDGLHEDLNRIAWHERPTIPEQKNDNLTDERAAKMAWTNHQSLNDSVMVTLFQGQLKSTVMCLTCHKKSVTFDPFVYLSLPVPSSSRTCTVGDCLSLFLREERMSGSSQWNCPQCKCARDAVKKIDVWKLPVILLIHLKRFSHDGFRYRKITAAVDFPLNRLDMRDFAQGPTADQIYDLYAVSNHYGTMEGGHYTAYAKNPITRSWHKFDDHEVSALSPGDVRSSAAYILFYTSKEFSKV